MPARKYYFHKNSYNVSLMAFTTDDLLSSKGSESSALKME